jgi:cation:H+ antiporter
LLVAILLIVAGFALLVAGGETLLRGAVGLARLVRLTPAVIGLTVVAAGTSVPELAVSVIAAMRGSADITVGNVVGSNIFNITVVVGLAALIRPLAIGGNTIRLEYPALALVTLMALVASQDGVIGRLDAVLFLTAYVLFTIYMLSLVRGQMNQDELTEYHAEVRELGAARGPRAWASLGLLAGGVALLTVGAQAAVSGAVGLARLLGLSERVIGLTIVAAGTGLPEVVTSMVSSYRGRDDVAIGNVLGSSLFNILGILGLSALFRPLAVHPGIVHSDNWWMLGITLLLFPLMYFGKRVSRRDGVVLLGAYGTYLAVLFARA